jgi:ABC-type cobalamin/Fe3+-siderophores transport system ATPase subunit
LKPPLFSLERVFVEHRGRILLRNVFLSLSMGESLGVIGPNGAGKSSLLMALLGFRKITSGKAHFFSSDLRNLGNRGWSKIRKRAGYLPQQIRVDPLFPITVEEVVLLGRVGHAGFLNSLTEEDRAVADSWIEAFRLNDLRKRPYGQLSGGEQQKANLARLMAQSPEILFLDEPTAGLDLKWQIILGELIEEIAEGKKTGIVMVTHEIHHLPPSCKKLALFYEGEMILGGPREEVLNETLLSEIYGCRVRPSAYAGRTYLLPWRPHDQ